MATDWAPETPLKSNQRCPVDLDENFRGGEGLSGPGFVAGKVSFMASENPKPNFVIIEKSDDKIRKQRKKREKVKRHRPRVLDKTKTRFNNKPTNPSTPKSQTPKRRKLADKTPVEPPKAASQQKELPNSNQNIRRRKLDFEIENQTTTDQNKKVSVEIEEVGAKQEDNVKQRDDVRNRFNSIIVYKRVFRPNECLKNSKKIGPNFPAVFKKARTRRSRATIPSKNNCLGRLTRSQTRKLAQHSLITNLSWKTKKKRSNMVTRKYQLLSFLSDISKLNFSEDFISRASAIRNKNVGCDVKVDHLEGEDNIKDDGYEIRVGNMECEDNIVVSCNEGIPGSEEPKSTVQRELHRDNTYPCPCCCQNFLEDSEDPEVEMSLEDDDVLSSHCDWFKRALVDFASMMMGNLKIDDKQHDEYSVKENAIIPSEKNDPRKKQAYQDEYSVKENAIIPSKKNDPRKKQKPEMNRDLDLAMSSGKDKDAEAEYWARERLLFEGRLDVFINALNPIQGHKGFSRWKGSLVDSSAGAYLTQNVSDHLSSSAFMSLVSRFPPVSDHSACDGESGSGRLKITEGREQFLNIEIEPTLYPGQIEVNLENETKVEATSSQAESILFKSKSAPEIKKGNKGKKDNQNTAHWDSLRTTYSSGKSKNRSSFNADSVNWEAVRQTPVEELANVIKARGMSKVLATKIKDFLDRLVKDHGAIDLEWLRDVPPEKAKEFLLGVRGLGPKSVECVRLLSLQHSAFPVDVNISRIATRLNWITLHDLPDGLQIHQLKEYPHLDRVQDFLAPRLMHISHAKLYEFHCHLILFGKSICTKDNPNCRVCPFKGQCKHYESKCASERAKLEGCPEKQNMSGVSTEASSVKVVETQPIIDIPESPLRDCSEPVCMELGDIEDFCSKDEIEDFCSKDEMLTLDISEKYREVESSLTCVVSTHPTLNWIQIQRLRTIHKVYELEDSNPLLATFNKRDPSDPHPYLLKVWEPGMPETESYDQMRKKAKQANKSEELTKDIVLYQDEGMVKGTILIPCRTALGGSFPLNGTYFQINEMFADHETSKRPIDIPIGLTYNLSTRLLFCSTSIHSICKGMETPDQIGYFFNAGHMCIRGFDRKMRAPRPLDSKFHNYDRKKKED